MSIFNLPLQSNTANYTFALNIPDGSTDLYFHLAGPTAYSWIAVGTGSEMADSMMFVMYSNADGTSEFVQSRKYGACRADKFPFADVTVSPRLSSGEQEPVYSPSIAVDLLDGTGINNGMITVNARCSNCTSWSTGSLDLQSTSQPWIFGLGPTGSVAAMLQSNSKSASIERHSEYGSLKRGTRHSKRSMMC